MAAGTVYRKTAKGLAEVKDRRLELEKAGVVADLRALAGPYREALAKAEGEEHAIVMAARLDEMLR